jgi:hypothetical protein
MLRRQLQLDRARTAVAVVSLGVLAVVIFVAQLRATYPGPVAVTVIGFAFSAFALVGAVRCFNLFVRPERHWIGKCLRQINPRPWELARTIDAEWRADGVVVEGRVPRIAGWGRPDVWFTVLTENWLVHVSPGRIVILMPDQIGWVYRKIIASKFSIFGRVFRHAVACRMAGGATDLDVFAKTEMIALWLAADLVRRQPHVLTGYQGDWVDLVGGNPVFMVARLEQRRREFEALSRAEQALWVEEREDELEEYPRRMDPSLPETMK